MKNLYIALLLISNAYILAIDKYFVTAADHKYFNHLLNLIGSIHETNFEGTKEIAIFDLGLTADQFEKLTTIEKVCVYKVKKTHPDILKSVTSRLVPGWYAWKPVVIKQALDKFPYVLWVDAGTTILGPLDELFFHIKHEGYFLATIGECIENSIVNHTIDSQTTNYVKNKFKLNTPENNWILSQEAVMAGVIGVTKEARNIFIVPMYKLSWDLKNYIDDGSCPRGFGAARYEQALLGIFAYLEALIIHRQDATQKEPIQLVGEGGKPIPFYITWIRGCVCPETHIFSSRGWLRLDYYLNKIRYK